MIRFWFESSLSPPPPVSGKKSGDHTTSIKVGIWYLMISTCKKAHPLPLSVYLNYNWVTNALTDADSDKDSANWNRRNYYPKFEWNFSDANNRRSRPIAHKLKLSTRLTTGSDRGSAGKQRALDMKSARKWRHFFYNAFTAATFANKTGTPFNSFGRQFDANANGTVFICRQNWATAHTLKSTAISAFGLFRVKY